MKILRLANGWKERWGKSMHVGYIKDDLKYTICKAQFAEKLKVIFKPVFIMPLF